MLNGGNLTVRGDGFYSLYLSPSDTTRGVTAVIPKCYVENYAYWHAFSLLNHFVLNRLYRGVVFSQIPRFSLIPFLHNYAVLLQMYGAGLIRLYNDDAFSQIFSLFTESVCILKLYCCRFMLFAHNQYT
jgi:hypothetical protein